MSLKFLSPEITLKYEMLLISLSCLLIVTLQASSHVNEQYLVCKPVESMFSNNDGTENETREAINDRNANARPGKRGARGLQGSPGPIGPPGLVDYERINEQLRDELRDINRQLRCHDGVVVDQSCYRLPYRVGVRINYDQARDLCIFHGGLLAEIPTEDAYNAVFNYVKRSWYVNLNHKDLDYVEVWLDSVYQNGNVILRNERRGYTRWYPTYPIQVAGSNRMALHVHIKPARNIANTGMFNCPPSNVNIPLCQFALE